MRSRILLISGISAGFFILALLTGPPSFDATDGAEFAVCGSELQIAHAPGYPLFLMMIRVFSVVFSPLYGHLRILNCFLAAAATAVGTAAFRKAGYSFIASIAGTVLFLSSAPVLSQFNSLEIYPLAIVLVLLAIYLKDSALSPYISGMAVFGGHPVSLLSASLFVSFKKKWTLLLFLLVPATLYLYIPLRSGACRIAHYGHPHTIESLIGYFTMYSERLSIPSFARLATALGFIGIPALAVFTILAAAGGRFRARRDLPIIAALLFLASYSLPDPAGQLWILLLPLSIRSTEGIQSLFERSPLIKAGTVVILFAAAVNGIVSADRTDDDIAMRWTTDVMSSLQQGSIYRPVAHDAFYAAYAWQTLGFRPDVILSDSYGNYFEFSPPPPIPPEVGGRTVHISRAWNRTEDFSLQGLIFSPAMTTQESPDLNQMAIFGFSGKSPDPMAMDIVAEAWMRRMIQEDDPALKDSFYIEALEFSATPLTWRRIESIRENY
jgi:hypothetical protein